MLKEVILVVKTANVNKGFVISTLFIIIIIFVIVFFIIFFFMENTDWLEKIAFSIAQLFSPKGQ